MCIETVVRQLFRRVGRLPTLLGVVLALCVSSLCPTPAGAWEVNSYARVNDDGSLRIDGHTIHLAGIHIPDTANSCKMFRNPPLCGSRAKVALEFKIDRFVRCEILSRNADGSLNGLCRVNSNSFDAGDDLAAYLLEQGWAVALPDASVKYQTLEKIARHRGVGVWGMPVDNVVRDQP